MQYVICPRCGAHLDFGEKCDCDNETEPEIKPPAEEGSDTEEDIKK